MPALTFGLNHSKATTNVLKTKPAQKRKAVFDDDELEDAEHDRPVAPALQTKLGPVKPTKLSNAFADAENEEDERPKKSPRLTPSTTPVGSSTNLSALRSSKLHDAQASSIDSSVYDYDAVYDTFSADAQKRNKSSSTNGTTSGPKYMTSLLTSAEQRKRDLLRAKEKVLQREREQEGEEFADKEKFVTGGYKKVQEEMRLAEEEEKRKAEEEEKRRRAGGGMLEWNRKVLEREGERMRGIEEEVERRKIEGENDAGVEEQPPEEDEQDESEIAKDLNSKGGRIIVNDEGEVVDKRQLLSAGLNTAPKKPASATMKSKSAADTARPQEYQRSSQPRNAREAQRERQSRMMERQIEEMTAAQQKSKYEEEKLQEEKSKSRITEGEKMSARERYLQRKKEREEEQAKKGKGG